MTSVPMQPVAGPHRPVATSPPRRSGSMRRTSTIDTAWPDDTGRTVISVRGQDLVTDGDGRAEVIDELDVDLTVELATGEILAVSDEAHGGLIGSGLRSGFGRHVAHRFADRCLARSVLEDAPGALFVSGYAPLRAGLLRVEPDHLPVMVEHQADVCVGWARGGELLDVVQGTGQNPVPYGPAAPTLEADDPDGWHALPGLGTKSMRRRRLLDVARDGDGLAVTGHFRDSYRAEDHEMVLHEYLVDASVDAAGVVAAVTADPRTLPWKACPAAIDSASTVIGVALPDLPARVRVDLVGPATCTHLNSTLRTLADVEFLSARVSPGQAERS